MTASDANLQRMIDACAPLWAAEAEIVRTYWDWPGRSRDTDRLWLFRQAYKEFWNGFFVCFDRMKHHLEPSRHGIDAAALVDLTQVAGEELGHYLAFARLYGLLRLPNEPEADPKTLLAHGDWPENVALMKCRKRHRERFETLGSRACWLTEGGYFRLYDEGAKLAGRGGIDDRIAAVCERVRDDEREHMQLGLADLERDGLDDAAWSVLIELTVEQLRLRITMRNAQFGYPVGEGRAEALRMEGADPGDLGSELRRS